MSLKETFALKENLKLLGVFQICSHRCRNHALSRYCVYRPNPSHLGEITLIHPIGVNLGQMEALGGGDLNTATDEMFPLALQLICEKEKIGTNKYIRHTKPVTLPNTDMQ